MSSRGKKTMRENVEDDGESHGYEYEGPEAGPSNTDKDTPAEAAEFFPYHSTQAERKVRRLSKQINYEEMAEKSAEEAIEERAAAFGSSAVYLPWKIDENGKALKITQQNLHELTVTAEDRSAVIYTLRYLAAATSLVTELIEGAWRLEDSLKAARVELADRETQVAALMGRNRQYKKELQGFENGSQEATPASSDSQAPHKNKALGHPERLDDGTDPTFEFWKEAVVNKIDAEPHNYPTARAQASYIISRTKGKAAGHIQPYLKLETYKEDPQGLLKMLEGIFVDRHAKSRARRKLKSLYFRKGGNFQNFRSDFTTLITEGEYDPSQWKSMLFEKLPDCMKEQCAEYDYNEDLSYEDLVQKVSGLAFVQEGIAQKNNALQRGRDRRSAIGGSKIEPRDSAKQKAEPKEPPPAIKQDPAKLKQFREGRCFTCQGTGHLARDCLYGKPAVRGVEALEGQKQVKFTNRPQVKILEREDSEDEDSEKE